MLDSYSINHNRQAGTLLSTRNSTSSQHWPYSSRYISSSSRSEPSTVRENAQFHAAGSIVHSVLQTEDIESLPERAALHGTAQSFRFNEGPDAPPKWTPRMAEGATDVSESLATHQGRLIRLTDKVLLKRAQMQHQQATVETCRNFYNSSLTTLNPNSRLRRLGDPQGQVGPRKGKRRKRRSKLNENGDIDPLKLEVTPTPTVPDVEQDQVIAAAHPVAPEPDSVEHTALDSPAEFSSLLDQYHSDYDILMIEEAKLKAVMEELSSLEFEIKELHESMRTRLASRHFVRDLYTALGELSLEPLYSSKATSKAGTKTPSLIDEYFDEKGNLGVFRERLQELEYWFNEGLLERALIADRGDPLDVTDEQFQQTYDVRRKDLIEDIETAEMKAMVLAQQCREAGLDIDRYRNNNPSIQDASTAGRANSVRGIYIPGDEEPGMALVPLHEVKSHSPAGNRSSSKINTWLRTVPNQPEYDPNIGAEENPKISSEEAAMEADQTTNAEETTKEIDQTTPLEEPRVESEQTISVKGWVSLDATESQEEERFSE